jgi:hypothetical protein
LQLESAPVKQGVPHGSSVLELWQDCLFEFFPKVLPISGRQSLASISLFLFGSTTKFPKPCLDSRTSGQHGGLHSGASIGSQMTMAFVCALNSMHMIRMASSGKGRRRPNCSCRLFANFGTLRCGNEAGPGPSLACFSNCTRSLVLFHSSSSFRSVLETPGASCSHGLSRLATRGLEVVADATVHGCYLLREQLLEDQPRENNASRLCCLPKVGHLIRAT